MSDEKYYPIDKDGRFPLVVPSKAIWQSLNSYKFIAPETCSIYLLKCLSNGKLYVGSDAKGKRAKDHKRELTKNKHVNRHLQSAFNKYGIENFYYYPLVAIPLELVQYRDYIENSYIKLFDSYHNGFNICEFADSTIGYKHTEETRLLLSEMAKNRVGKLNPNWGKKMSPEAVEANRARMKQHWKEHTPPMLGKSHSEDTRQKMKENHADFQKENHPQFGTSKSVETIKKISDAKSYPVYLLSPTGKLTYVKNITEFSKEHRFTASLIYQLIQGKIKQAKDWRIPKEMRDYSLEEITQMKIAERASAVKDKIKEFWYLKEGLIIKVGDLKKFCREEGLSYGAMHFVYHGTKRYKSHKGFTSAKNLQLI